MRPDAEISRCKCPRCVAVRRMHYATVAAICVTLASSGYLVLDLLRSRHPRFRNVTLEPQTFPHPSPSAVVIEAQPSASPASQQHSEIAAESAAKPAVVSAPISEPSSPPVESALPPSSVIENSPVFQIETATVWSPIVLGILPRARCNLSTNAQVRLTLAKPEVTSSPGTVVIVQAIADDPKLSANAQSLPRDHSWPERKANDPKDNGTPSQKSDELSSKPRVAVASPDHILKTPEGARKARQIELTQSFARLYSSKPTPPPTTPTPQQRDEAEASTPPVQEPAPSKSVGPERGAGTDMTGDLRRFAASYLLADEREDVASQAGYYAGSVHFYGEGDLSWTRIAAATRRYHQSSRQRRYAISAASIRGPVNGGFWIIEQPFSWTKMVGTRVQTGRSVLRMWVIPWGRGNFKITSISYE
jgi:hypothetical protein